MVVVFLLSVLSSCVQIQVPKPQVQVQLSSFNLKYKSSRLYNYQSFGYSTAVYPIVCFMQLIKSYFTIHVSPPDLIKDLI